MKHLARFLAAIAAISALTVAAALYPQRNEAAPFVILTVLLLSLIAAGIFTFRSWTADRTAAQRSSGKKVPVGLATLSSAAILAVYAAGYHRTASATDTFSEHSSGRGAALVIAANIAAAPLNAAQIHPALNRDRAVPPPISPAFPPEPRPALGAAAIRLTRSPADSKPEASSAEPEASTPAPAFNMSAAAAPVQQQSAPVAEVAAPQIFAPSAADPGIALTAPEPAIAKPKTQFKDGTYTGWGSCRHGDIQASVTIQDGKIVSSAITQCLTRYSCSWISNLPRQVVARQSPNVDYVSGASQSTDAFYYAIVDALSKARQ